MVHVTVPASQKVLGSWQRVRARLSIRRLLTGALAGLGLVGAVIYGQHYWTVGRFLEQTDDAYVKADFTIVAPKVSGYIAEVLVNDNQPVKAGQIVARIDDRDFRTALDQADANLAAAESAIRNIDAQLDLQGAIIEQARAQIAGSQAAVTFAQKDHARYDKLMNTGYGTTQRAQQAETALRDANARLLADKAGLDAATRKIAVLQAERENAVAERDRNIALRHQAELNLSYTRIVAPVDGTVGARALRVGQYVQAGTQLMAVVPLHAVYIVANFKETQLTRMHKGQPVEISVDSFPGVELTGHVDSLSPASGLEFSLLPPDNATGNFTKIVQRVPVKIVIDDSPLAGLLRAGMSVEPRIDTRG
jgi:membrane fusion protein (multidrug efflux system)